MQNGTSNVWYVYADIPFVPFFTTVGVENEDGTVGDSYYSNGTGTGPSVGTDLTIDASVGGTATLGFQVITDCSENPTVNTADLSNGANTEKAIAVTTCP